MLSFDDLCIQRQFFDFIEDHPSRSAALDDFKMFIRCSELGKIWQVELLLINLPSDEEIKLLLKAKEENTIDELHVAWRYLYYPILTSQARLMTSYDMVTLSLMSLMFRSGETCSSVYNVLTSLEELFQVDHVEGSCPPHKKKAACVHSVVFCSGLGPSRRLLTGLY